MDVVSAALTTANSAPTFSGADGKVFIPFEYGGGAYARTSSVLPDGSILVAGSVNIASHSHHFALVRLNPDGSLDRILYQPDEHATFGPIEAGVVTVHPGGEFTVLGYTASDWGGSVPSALGIIRFDHQGEVLSTPEVGNVVYLPYLADASLQLLADGRFLLAGYTQPIRHYWDSDPSPDSPDLVIQMLNQDGSVDEDFGVEGKLIFPLPSEHASHRIELVESSVGVTDILVHSYSTHPFSAALHKVQLDTNTDAGNAAVRDGLVTLQLPEALGEARFISMDEQGRLLFVGSSRSEDGGATAFYRLNADASLDHSFAQNGVLTVPASLQGDYRAASIFIDASGETLLVGKGNTNASYALSRFDSMGMLDTAFATAGERFVSLHESVSLDRNATQLPDGTLVFVGSGSHAGSDRGFFVLKATPDGLPDYSFSSAYNSLDTSIDVEAWWSTTFQGAVPLDRDVHVFDAELNALGNYGGATLTLQREGGAHWSDVFSKTGALGGGHFFEAEDLFFDNTLVAKVLKNSDGVLQLVFTEAATQLGVDAVLSSIAYFNIEDTSLQSFAIEWVFDDGNTGAQGTGGNQLARGVTQVNILEKNERPNLIQPLSDVAVVAGESVLIPIHERMFVDPNGDALSYRVGSRYRDDTPDWVSFDRDSHQIVASTESVEKGSYDVTLTADDGHLYGTSGHTFRLHVVAEDSPLLGVNASIAGPLAVGHSVSANLLDSALEADGYRWFLDGEALIGEIGPTLALGYATVGKAISVEISLNDEHTGGFDVQSANTAPIAGEVPTYQHDDAYYWDSSLLLTSGASASATELQLFRTYFGAMQRAPDAEGFEWWLTEIEAGRHDLQSMAEGFLWSQEFLAYVGTDNANLIDNAVFVQHMYQGILGRAADWSGRDWWIDTLESGERTQATALLAMTQSNEFVEKTRFDAADYLFLA